MTHQRELFDAAASEAGKEAGMARAADGRRDLLEYARRTAVGIALSRPDRTCTADDVQRLLHEQGVGVHALGNAAGSLFRGGWEWTGRWVKSERKHAHANLLRVWKYVGGGE